MISSPNFHLDGGCATRQVKTAGLIDAVGTVGKSVFGDNSVGNFVDDWINPFSIVKDVKDAMVEKAAQKIETTKE